MIVNNSNSYNIKKSLLESNDIVASSSSSSS